MIEFILLENVAAKFRNPCVLDIKMGTRQHGDDATEEKKERFIKKCQMSTSSIIGTRLIGMQVSRHHFITTCRNVLYKQVRIIFQICETLNLVNLLQ